MNLTQSAVSLHVKRLEDQVGSRLLFPEHGLPSTLKSLGSAEGLPTLPDFEFVLRRSRTCFPAADHLADMIINFFQLSTAVRPGSGMPHQEGRLPGPRYNAHGACKAEGLRPALDRPGRQRGLTQTA